MKGSIIVLKVFCILFSFSSVHAQEVYPLYERPIPNSLQSPERERREVNAAGRESIEKVSVPTLTAYIPKDGNTKRPAVVICPGGGYARLAFTHEGHDVARAFARWGFAAFVLKYRLPDDSIMQQKHLGPLQDAQEAIAWVRSKGAKWNIDTSRVAIMGFSAGGHLASTAGTHFSRPVALPATTNVRPDLMMLIYPVISFEDSLAHKGSRQNLLGASPAVGMVQLFSNDQQVTAQTPPTFLVHAKDDITVPVGNSLAFAAALKKTGVPYQVKIFEQGGHGFGMFNPTSSEMWMDDLHAWLQQMKWLPAYPAMESRGPGAAFPDLQQQAPMIGAEVFIEPGQSPGYIDSLFLTLQQHHMTITRIRLFENYMRKADGSWDFSLFDQAYLAAEKYGINIWGNFFPATSFEDVGGFKFPRSRAHLDSIADFIRQVVLHFRSFKSHGGWALLNEIGSAKVPASPLSQERYQAWMRTNAYRPQPQQYRGFGFDEQRFLVEHNTWYLQWLAGQVRRYDPDAHLHVNNHAIFQLAGEYDFPSWRSVLSSFGGSAHASWHFGYFKRNRYSYAVAANSAILQAGAGNKPWLMTELQGGNNTYSGYDAMCPTKEEIAQWIWSVVGGGGKGAIFWSLNPRAGGFEAGEWAMLDYQGQPSDRLQAAGEVARVMEQHAALLAKARPVAPAVHLLYTRSSLWVEEKMQMGGAPLEGRETGGVMKSVLGYYETLLEMGVPASIGDWESFDFSKQDYAGQVIILAHQVSLPRTMIPKLEHFVRQGGTLIVDGLTGYYDENAIATMQTGFPLQPLLGGRVLEWKMEGNEVPLRLNNSSNILPGHAWRGYLQPTTGRLLSTQGQQVFALQNQWGRGTVLWWPTLVGLGSRMQGNNALAACLQDLFRQQSVKAPLSFSQHYPGLQMQTLQTEGGWISIMINKSGSKVSPRVLLPAGVKARVLYGAGTAVQGTTTQLQPEETLVVFWAKQY